ncbi:MAG TPA: hypothetical protein VGO58_01860, partial [Chitinophagaceae bacterium]|nr:hypothetical protein [Chitinophagaceae bacterium]
TKTYTILTPVYKEKTEVYANIKSNTPVKVGAPGKLFVYGNYIFLNEVDKGVHIIDNSNPANPVIKAFINIPGNLDIAVKGNTLYADLYSDMVVVDISNPLQARYVKHVNNVFPERQYTNGFIADSNRIIVDWTRKDTTVDIRNYYCNRCNYLALADAGGGPMTAGGSTIGVAGSMARFSIVNNFIYTVNDRDLTSFDISTAENPVKTSTRQVGWRIETIYPFSNKLFIGSNTGMFIYDISTPASPVQQGQFSHVRSCDPVIADGNFAWVTLRSGNTCNTMTNELQLVNISNVFLPAFVKSYGMTNPHGLTKDNNLLFICDGKDGLKMYDASDPMNISLKKQATGIETYDAIAMNGNLVLVAKDGLYQYTYSTAGNLDLRSKISVSR